MCSPSSFNLDTPSVSAFVPCSFNLDTPSVSAFVPCSFNLVNPSSFNLDTPSVSAFVPSVCTCFFKLVASAFNAVVASFAKAFIL